MSTDERPEFSDGETTIRAQNIRGVRSIEVIAEGDAEVERADLTASADRLTYKELTDEVFFDGNVRFERGEDTVTAERGRFVVYEETGEFYEPTYEVGTTTRSRETGVERTIAGRGDASMMHFRGENRYALEDATWTTCQPESSDWYIRAREIELDYDAEEGVAHGSSLVFKGVPLMYAPRMSFPLGDQRKSGFLVPTVALSDKTGFDMAVPYYWNIAPNYDATLVPRVMSKRGLQLGGEVRYLTARSSGITRMEWMAKDKLTEESRGLVAIQHNQRITSRLRASLDFNHVTDNEYFEDLSSTLQVSSRRNLLRQGRLTYSGGWWNASAMAQAFQTVGENPIGPYRRLPQLTFSARRADLPAGLEFGMESEYVHFRHGEEAIAPRLIGDRVIEARFIEARRMHAYPHLSWRYDRPGWYVKPRLGVHYTRYDLDEAFIVGGRTSITRSLPIFSVDAGMYFDRDSRLFGTDMQQTLEPRLYYVRIPYREQDDIPRFDTASYDFGYAQLFSENRYSGIDRVGDANQITAALTTRFIESATGVERLRATIGQRFYFDDRRVRLNPREELSDYGRTDILATFSGRLTQATSLELMTQYDPEQRLTQRTNVRFRYQPEHLKVFNIGYRYLRSDSGNNDLRDIDVSAQWPLGGRWYGVGRVTRSIEEKRTTEALLGLEYVSRCGCWAMRTALHRFAINPDDVNTALFFQLELTGLGGIGSSPIKLLRRSVPGYGVINEPVADPYFGN